MTGRKRTGHDGTLAPGDAVLAGGAAGERRDPGRGAWLGGHRLRLSTLPATASGRVCAATRRLCTAAPRSLSAACCRARDGDAGERGLWGADLPRVSDRDSNRRRAPARLWHGLP